MISKFIDIIQIIKRYFLMQALEFPRGNYYQILCQQGALRIQENDPENFNKSRVVATQPNNMDNGQLFMIEKIGLADDHYEIVNCLSSLVFDEESHEIRLKAGKQSKDQLFALEPAPIESNPRYYWIKTDAKKGNKALAFEGILRIKDFDPNAPNQLFILQQVSNYTIDNSAVIINNLSGKALDVPHSSRKHGERLIVWEKNKRWNQRWQFQKHGKGVLIKSVLTGQCADIANQKRDSGAKVVQWDQTGGSNQQWIPEPSGNGLFRFRSVHEHSLFLAIKKQNVNDGGQLEVCSEQNPSMYWRIEGCHPI